MADTKDTEETDGECSMGTDNVEDTPPLLCGQASLEQEASVTAGLDAKALRILQGCMKDLPSLPSNTIRIFLSSTFSGTGLKNIKQFLEQFM